jgi:hypothetical protein
MESQIIGKAIQFSAVSFKTAHRASIISFVCLIGMFLSLSQLQRFPDIVYLSTLLAIAFHVALLPVVSAMPAIGWTKIGGYTWVVADIILAVAGLNGIPNSTIEPFRFGVHVTLVMWPIGIAFANTGFIKWASWGFAITTGSIPLMGTLLPPAIHFIGLPFIITWYVAVILKLKKLMDY